MGFIWRPWALMRDNLKLGNATLCESPTFTPLHCCKRPVAIAYPLAAVLHRPGGTDGEGITALLTARTVHSDRWPRTTLVLAQAKRQTSEELPSDPVFQAVLALVREETIYHRHQGAAVDVL